MSLQGNFSDCDLVRKHVVIFFQILFVIKLSFLAKYGLDINERGSFEGQQPLLSSLFESGDKNTVKNMLSNETINHYEKFPLGNNFRLVFSFYLFIRVKQGCSPFHSGT